MHSHFFHKHQRVTDKEIKTTHAAYFYWLYWYLDFLLEMWDDKMEVYNYNGTKKKAK